MRSIVISIVLVYTAGCAAVFGPHYAPLPIAQVRSLELGLAGGGDRFCVAGPEAQLRVGARLGDGRALVTWAYRVDGTAQKDGYLDFAALRWRTTAGVVLDDGRYQPPGDPTVRIGQPVTIEASVPDRPDLAASRTLVPRYDCPDVVELAGTDGGAGMAGLDGAAGQDGSDGEHPGDGGNGGNGGNGGDGGDGEPGPAVEVALGMVDSPRGPLILARVTHDQDRVRYAILDPGGPPLLVTSRGGGGGTGGRAGRGGAGGKGGRDRDSMKSGSDGSRGLDGLAGRRGIGGAGGAVRITYDVGHPALRWMVTTDVRGGDGRDAGPDGPPAYIAAAPADALFARELARGLAVER